MIRGRSDNRKIAALYLWPLVHAIEFAVQDSKVSAIPIIYIVEGRPNA